MAFKRSGVRFPSPPWLAGPPRRLFVFAGIAQLVEHNLAKVGVAGSSPVSRSLVRSFARFVFVLLETGEQRGG